VNEWVPTSNVVLIDAVPPVTVTGVPRKAAPSLNCTLPTTVGVIVAVHVSTVPASAGAEGLALSCVEFTCGGVIAIPNERVPTGIGVPPASTETRRGSPPPHPLPLMALLTAGGDPGVDHSDDRGALPGMRRP
jgi:hypothetical protein